MNATAQEKVLSTNLPFWGRLTADEKQVIVTHTAFRSYAKGETLHTGGDKCLGVVIILSGQVRTYMLSEEGRDITLFRLFSGDTCILTASCILSEITFEVIVDAEEDTEALIISPEVFYNVTKANIWAENYAYRLAAERFSDVMWAMQQILFMGADKRLAIFLADEASKNGSDEIRLTHEQIARYMGTAREVVTRMLRYFSEEHIVTLSRGVITLIDKKKLRQLAV